MLRMLLRRLALGAITVAIVSIIIFSGVELLPGDACTAFLEREAKGKLLENCREAQGLNRGPIKIKLLPYQTFWLLFLVINLLKDHY